MISVVLICWNHSEYVTAAIDSVCCPYDGEIEFCLVDNGSSDNSVYLARKAFDRHGRDFHIIENRENLGVGAALNQALNRAKGEFFAPLSCDDVMTPHRLELQVEALKLNPKAFAACGGVMWIDSQGRPLTTAEGLVITSGLDLPSERGLATDLLESHGPPAPSAMYRTAALKNLSGFREDIVCEDFDLWVRAVLGMNHEVVFVPQILAGYRQHSLNATSLLSDKFPLSQIQSLESLDPSSLAPDVFQLVESALPKLQHLALTSGIRGSFLRREPYRRRCLSLLARRSSSPRHRVIALLLLLLPRRVITSLRSVLKN